MHICDFFTLLQEAGEESPVSFLVPNLFQLYQWHQYCSTGQLPRLASPFSRPHEALLREEWRDPLTPPWLYPLEMRVAWVVWAQR